LIYVDYVYEYAVVQLLNKKKWGAHFFRSDNLDESVCTLSQNFICNFFKNEVMIFLFIHAFFWLTILLLLPAACLVIISTKSEGRFPSFVWQFTLKMIIILHFYLFYLYWAYFTNLIYKNGGETASLSKMGDGVHPRPPQQEPCEYGYTIRN